jgi:hypothetical protein
VEAAVNRKKQKIAKKNKKAQLHANKLMDLDIAMQTPLVQSRVDLDGEIASYGNAKGALKNVSAESG